MQALDELVSGYWSLQVVVAVEDALALKLV